MYEKPNLKDVFSALAAPFHPKDIEWRAGATNSDKTKALALAYITSRAVMDRLDEVISPENWRDEYKSGPDGGVTCGLSLRFNNEWITKWDGAENTDFEAIKGGLSDAFKRAGVKWGVGRYLYKLEAAWVPCEMHGKSIVLKAIPSLPAWALPKEIASSTTSKVEQSQSDREKQLLSELGYDVKDNGSNGNKPASKPAEEEKPKSNGKHARSWNINLVQAVLNARLAKTPVEAVKLLNNTELDSKASPEQAILTLQAMSNG